MFHAMILPMKGQLLIDTDTCMPCPPCCLVVRMMLVETCQSTVYWLGNSIQDLLLVFRMHIIQGIHYLSCRTENWCQFRVCRAAAGNAKKRVLWENQGKSNCVNKLWRCGTRMGKNPIQQVSEICKWNRHLPINLINHQSHQPPHHLRLSDREVGDLSHLLHGRQGDTSQARIHRIGMDRLPPWGLPSERLGRITPLKIDVSLWKGTILKGNFIFQPSILQGMC